MDCWYPITIPRRNYYKDPVTKIVFSKAYGRMQVPCGRCPACRRRKQNEWAFRILEEAKVTRLTAFITFTYSDDKLPYSDSGIPTLVPDHLTTLNKNLRYDLSYQDPYNPKKKISYRFFACGEYGDQFERPHMHMLFFYNGPLDHEQLEEIIRKRWTYGFIEYEVGITAGRAKYCAKYSMKQVGYDYGDCQPPFARMSRMPGLGKKFLDTINSDVLRKLDIWHVHDYQGTPYNMPRYYKDRIYSEQEREQHSLLVEQLKNFSFDAKLREYEENNTRSFYDFDAETNLNRERLFIKHLKKENYGFKYKPFKPKDRPARQSSEDLVTDEF